MLNYLEAFLSLSRTLNFSKTASEMHISQPCVSRQIRLLEEELSCQLFIRNKHQVFLSEKGKQLKEKVESSYNMLRSVSSDFNSHKAEISGTLSIGSISEVGQFYIMHKALEFAKKHPSITLDVEYLRQHDIIEKIKSGVITFGILAHAPKVENIRTYKLMKERIVLVKKNDFKISTTQNFVVYRKDDPLLRSFIRRFKKKIGISSYHEKIIVNSHKSMIDALLCNDYCAVMPYHAIAPLVEKGILTYLKECSIESDIYLAYYDNCYMDEKDKAFKKFIRTTP